jgi:single-stranded-DNA-specific exonuclease
MQKRWKLLKSDLETVRNISKQFGCHPAIATILANRGIISKTAVNAFLHPLLNQIRSYDKFIDMEKAACRIADAIIHNEKILIFGDYDVDGITSTAILFDFLQTAGARISYYIPHRIAEGYGLNKRHITGIAKPDGIGLIITVDCGSSSHEAVTCANESGIDVIITDHHAIPIDAPKAYAIINPHRQDCPSNSKFLAGVGVVFYLIICIRKHLRDHNHWNAAVQPNLKDYCDLVALGTIADIVPMVRENRIFTKIGLEILNSNPRPGIKALIQISGINKPYIDTEDIAYRIGPRLNSAGRMEHANLGVELILSKDYDKAYPIVEILNNLNSMRQKEENLILSQIDKFLKEEPKHLEGKTLVLCSEALHEGVIGIIASKLSEKFYRPVLLISFKDGIGKGSGRSIPGINLYDAVSACAGLLENFGGHPMAAGIRISQNNYILFKNAFEKTVVEMIGNAELEPFLEIDCELNFDMISDKLIDELNSLQPFGPQNAEPIFLSRNIEVAFSKTIGYHHQRMVLKQKTHSVSSRSFPAIWFNADIKLQNKRYFKEIAYKLRMNYWNGTQNTQIVIEDIR